MLYNEGLGGGDDVSIGVHENLTRGVGTTLYSAPEQLDDKEHSRKVSTCHMLLCLFKTVETKQSHFLIRPLYKHLLVYNV